MSHVYRSVLTCVAPILCLVGVLGTATSLFADAQELSGADRSHVTVTLLSEVTQVQPGAPFTVGLRFELDEHWHVYWRNPGDSGMEPRVTWDLPKGFHASSVRWPAPIRISLEHLVVFGYEEQVVLLVEITPPDNLVIGNNVQLTADIEWLVCDQVCVAGSGKRTLRLKVAPKLAKDSNVLALFDTYRKQLPTPSHQLGWKTSARLGKKTLDILLAPSDNVTFLPRSIWFFPNNGGFIDNAGLQAVQRRGGELVLHVPLESTSNNVPDRITGLLVTDQGGWLETGDYPAMRIDLPISTR